MGDTSVLDVRTALESSGGADTLPDQPNAEEGSDVFDASTADTGRDSTGGADVRADGPDAEDASGADVLADGPDAEDASGADVRADGPDAEDASGADVLADGPDAEDASGADVLPDRLDAGDGGPPCIQSLSNIGQGDYTISFDVTTTQSGSPQTALINQRAACGGDATFWDLRVYGGDIRLESQDTDAHLVTFLTSTVAINDGVEHAVSVTRTAGVVAMVIDGNAAGSAAETSAFGQLPPLVEGTDPCDGTGDAGCPNACPDGTLPFVGTVANLCISSP